MALNATKTSLIRTLSARAYSGSCPGGAAGASAATASGPTGYEVKTTVLPNKVVVASAENESPLARVSILFRAGSRNESGESLGATHMLRVAAGLSTCNSSQFSITRHLQQTGAVLSCTTTREIVSYTLEGTRKAIEECMPFLTDVATAQCFKPWELSDQSHRIKLELATRPPQQRVIDLLHQAAYRRCLGNSIYISKSQIGRISTETLQHYVASHFVSNKAAVVGLGVNHTELVNYAQSLELEGGKGESTPCKYKGGEVRKDKGGDLAYVAIAGEGASIKNVKEVAAFHVLRRALGAGPNVKRGQETQSLLAKSMGPMDEPYALSTFNSCYTDTGLLGVLAVGSSSVANKLVQATLKVLKGSRVSDGDVNRAKNQLKIDVLSSMENGTEAIEFMGKQAVLSGVIVSPGQVGSIIDSVTTAEVDAALKKVANSRLSMASYGNLSNVPYLDELK